MNEQDLNGLGQEPLNEERLRRMKTLMRQLYKEEFESKRFALPPIRGKTLIIFVSFLSIIVFGVTTLYNFNRFINLREWVWSAQGHVEDVLQRRSNLFSNLVNLTLNQAELEREVFRHVADARSRLNGLSKTAAAGKPAGQQAAATETATTEIGNGSSGVSDSAPGGDLPFSASLARLLAVVERYPDIKSSVTYQQLMDKLVVIEDRITKTRDDANERARIYNTLISSFPWYVLAKITGFERMDYYVSGTRSHTIPTLSPAIFDRLLPHPNATPKPNGSSGKGNP